MSAGEGDASVDFPSKQTMRVHSSSDSLTPRNAVGAQRVQTIALTPPPLGPSFALVRLPRQNKDGG